MMAGPEGPMAPSDPRQFWQAVKICAIGMTGGGARRILLQPLPRIPGGGDVSARGGGREQWRKGEALKLPAASIQCIHLP